jgi:hypothetical protein
VSAADKREELEAAIWRERGGDRSRGAEDVDRILAAADAYATAVAAETLDGVIRDRRQRDHRDALDEALRGAS